MFNFNKLIKCTLWLCVVFLSQNAVASSLQVLDMSLQAENGKEKIEVIFSEAVQSRSFLLQNPPRLVIDLPPFQWQVPPEKLQNYHGSLILNIRYARFDPQTSRIVLDLTKPVELVQSAQNQASKLELTILAVGEEGGISKPLSSRSIPTQDVTRQRLSMAVPPTNEPSIAAYAPKPAFRTAPIPQSKPFLKPLVMIDAGHGGQDPGTIGRHGTQEKQITLTYARSLKDALIRSGKFRAELTRDDDRFIILRDRFRLARQRGANLFISLHADSAPNQKARGLSVYTLSEEASDAEAAALAEQENKVDILADIDLTHEDKDVAEILIDLAQRDTKNKSIILADNLVHALASEVTLLPRPHRFADFAVLKAPDIPSALVEIGFLSHGEEEKLIQSSLHREQVVRGLAGGIENYFALQPPVGR